MRRHTFEEFLGWPTEADPGTGHVVVAAPVLLSALKSAPSLLTPPIHLPIPWEIGPAPASAAVSPLCGTMQPTLAGPHHEVKLMLVSLMTQLALHAET